MTTIKACCVCLAKDTKLTDVCDSGLDHVLYKFSGIQLTIDDVFHHMCMFCSALLMKSMAFREKCLNIKKTSDFFLNSCGMLANGDLLTIQLTNNLLHPYTITSNNNIIDIIYTPEIKYEVNEFKDELKYEIEFDNDVDVSDDEPLSRKVSEKHIIDINMKSELSEQINGQSLKYEAVTRKKRKRKKFSEEFNFDDEILFSDDEVKEVLLTKEQQIEEIEKRKFSKNYLQSLYQCHQCYKGFISEVTYDKHAVKHNLCSGEFECDVCRVRFPDRRGLRAHVINAHERNYMCKRCGHASKSRTKAKEHTKWHEGFKYNCEMCTASFSKATTYFSHLRARHSSSLQCGQCAATFHTASGLRLHLAKTHTNRTPEYSCPSCGLKFKNELALQKHSNSNALNATCDASLRACTQCGDNFLTEELLNEHMNEHGDTENRTYSCDECNRVFTKEIAYRKHFQTVHLGLKRTRPGDSSNMCEHCGLTCKSKASLIAHQRTHTGEKPFKCSFCEKCFGTMHHLYIHRRIHTGERPFKCPTCPKAFRHKAALNRHVRVHTGVKPYACPTCDKRFSQSNSAKSHIALVHMKPPAKHKVRAKEQ